MVHFHPSYFKLMIGLPVENLLNVFCIINRVQYFDLRCTLKAAPTHDSVTHTHREEQENVLNIIEIIHTPSVLLQPLCSELYVANSNVVWRLNQPCPLVLYRDAAAMWQVCKLAV